MAASKRASSPTPVPIPETAPRRRVILASLPSGPFGRALAAALRWADADVVRLIWSGGDRFDWGVGSAATFRRGETLDAGLDRIFRRTDATDVVVLGDANPCAAAALRRARALGVRTHILELGYLRPNWVTLETQGVNARSPLPRDAAFYERRAAVQVQADAPRIAPITRPQAWHTVCHQGAAWVAAWLHPAYVYPYEAGIWAQAFGWLRSRARLRLRRGVYRDRFAHLQASDDPVFTALLQRDGDSQLRIHSPYAGNVAFLRDVIADFAANAPPQARLAVKNHPLDAGLIDLERETESIAQASGVADRVVFLDGDIPVAALAAASRGVVSINSTAALTAIEVGTPVRLLGAAAIDIEGLVDRRPLAHFWQDAVPPRPGLYARVRAYLLDTSQVPGNFHNRSHLHATAERLARRMLAPPIAREATPPPLRLVAVRQVDPLAAFGADLRSRKQKQAAAVDVIVPVYGGRTETLACLRSVLAARVEVPFRLVVIDDATPEPRLADDLQRLADRGLFALSTNSTNQGFTRTVNAALGRAEGRDVVLLNADTEVGDGWLDRLRAVARHETVGTVTPLSDQATILSYPLPMQASAPPLEVSAAELDSLLAGLGEAPIEIPTAVGFCMYVTAGCLAEVGTLDDASFPRGYGEENDFSRRAVGRGWRNVAATNLYVRHVGAVSFGAERPALVRQAMSRMERLHPGYTQTVAAFIRADPLLPVRRRLDIARITAASPGPTLYAGRRRGQSPGGLALEPVGRARDGFSLHCPAAPVTPNLPLLDPLQKPAQAVELLRTLGVRAVDLRDASGDRRQLRALADVARSLSIGVA